MDMANTTANRISFRISSPDNHRALISDCVFMAGAIKRHYSDVALMFDDKNARTIVGDMNVLIEGSDALLASLSENDTIEGFLLQELTMLWNKLHHLVTEAFQQVYPSGKICH
ncbi:MAG TPA: hypothetical protein ENI05_07315 [Porticoccus sp.]|nr:hypothetical protein [Porticoccus sp.]